MFFGKGGADIFGFGEDDEFDTFIDFLSVTHFRILLGRLS